MTNLQCVPFCCDSRCFDAKSILSRFTRFCVEQKITNKSCPWSTNDKYDVWMEMEEKVEGNTKESSEVGVMSINWAPL